MSPIARRWCVRLLAPLLGAALVLFTRSASASYPNGWPVVLHHCEQSQQNVLTHPTQIIIAYWGWVPPGGSNQAIDSAARAFAAGDARAWHVLTQYYQRVGSCAAAQDPVSLQPMPVTTLYYYTAPSSSTPPQSEEQLVAYNILSQSWTNGALLVIVSPDGVYPAEARDPNQVSAYHDRTEDAQGDYPYVMVPYWSLQSGTANDLQHELEEMITDPNVARYGSATDHSGWWAQIPAGDAGAGITIGGSEIGDVCKLNAGTRSFQLLRSREAVHTFDLLPMMSDVGRANAGACVYAYATRADNFVLGTDNSLYQSVNQSGGWASWGRPSGVTLASGPTAVSHDPGFIDTFTLAGSGDLWQAAIQPGWTTAQWRNWGHPIGYTLIGKPAVASWGASRLDIYALAAAGLTKVLFHRSWDDGTDSGWQLLASSPYFTPGSSPTAASWGPGNVVVGVLSTNGPPNLWYAISSDGQNFAGWTAAGNNGYSLDSNASPAVGSHDEGTADFFVSDAVGSLKHFWLTNYGGTSGWDSLGNSGTRAKSGTGPTVVGRGDQRLLAGYTGDDGSFWQREYDFGWEASWHRILWPGGTYNEGQVSSW